MKLFILIVFLLLSASFSMVINPIVSTDKSVNTYSVKTIAADIIKPGMTDEQKLIALFQYHRRVMHHFRLQQATEDPSQNAGFDLIRLYTVYGCAWCTQQAAVFNTLCAEVFGSANTEGTAGNGILASLGTSGGHSSFHVRFNAADKWHWIDPIIGAYARNKTDGSIASFEEIAADPLILIDAEKDGRASSPYFPCTKGTNPITTELVSAYSYFDYDTAFITDFAAAWSQNPYTTMPAYFTSRKTLQKGEQYIFLWDFLPGSYFNLQDRQSGSSRDWTAYPPRHLCGWKDSLDHVNWPYFKPYKKVINDDTCYRYYANGYHIFEPDLLTDDPKDAPILDTNVSFHVDDSIGPMLKPLLPGQLTKIAWRCKLPYPLMSMHLICDYTRTDTNDSLAIYMKRLTFNIGNYPDLDKNTYPNYKDTLTSDPGWKRIKSFPVNANGTLDTMLRAYVDPLNTSTTYQGYSVMLVMRTSGPVTNVGINRLRIESIFQHNMFALPQLEPGDNRVTVTSDSANLNGENTRVAFAWYDNGEKKVDVRDITASPQNYTLTVNQSEIPKMLYMAVGNTRDSLFGLTEVVGTEPVAVNSCFTFEAYPNPFNPVVRFNLNGLRQRSFSSGNPIISIYAPNGKEICKLNVNQEASPLLWDASGYPSGLYIAGLKWDSHFISRKIILVK